MESRTLLAGAVLEDALGEIRGVLGYDLNAEGGQDTAALQVARVQGNPATLASGKTASGDLLTPAADLARSPFAGFPAAKARGFSLFTLNNAPAVVNPVPDVTVAEDASNTLIDLGPVFTDPDLDALVYAATVSTPIDSLVAQVSQSSYTTLHQDLLYTHTGDNRGVGGWEHDLARENIHRYFAGLGLQTSLEPFVYNSQTYYNVVGVYPGVTRPNDVYLVGAHYDSVNNPGADDNAIGVAAVMELARVMTQYPFDATLVFVAFDREEQGMKGSYAYTTSHSTAQIKGMLSLDMIAYNIPGAGHDTVRFYDYITGGG